MRKEDKIIAIAGVVLIVILAIVAIFLLFGSRNMSSSLVSVVPQQETVELPETEAYTTNVDDSETEAIDASTIEGIDSGVSLKAKSKKTEKYVKCELKEIKNDDSQLKELAYYWDEYRLDAVADLIRLERLRIFTDDLEGTNQFYYCGELDDNKQPNGKGLAVYSDNTYYYGEWVKGLRDGNGMWLKIYIDELGVEGSYTAILEHQYNGQWKNDLPNGEGQEHYTLQHEDITGEYSLANVIGGFKNGYYDGEVYIMTAYSNATTNDWYANAKMGVFDYCEPNKISTTNKRPVWRKGNDNDHSTDEADGGYYWMLETENTGFGIYNLKK